MIENIRSLGVLRILLLLVALCFLPIVPFGEPTWNPVGWDVLLGAVVPALTPLIVILLLFDALMCWIWKIDSTDDKEKSSFKFAITVDLIVAILLASLWVSAFSDGL